MNLEGFSRPTLKIRNSKFSLVKSEYSLIETVQIRALFNSEYSLFQYENYFTSITVNIHI